MSTAVFKNLLPCHGEYSYHRQGCTWQTKQHFQTSKHFQALPSPSTISGGQLLGISKRMKIMLLWQNCLTAPSAFHQEASGTWQCAFLSMHQPPLGQNPVLFAQESPRGDGPEQRRRSSSLEWNSLISWTNHATLHLCLECRVGTLPTAILATETAGKGKTPAQQAPFVSMEKCRSLSRICPQQLKGTSAGKWYYNCQWVAVLLFYYDAQFI